MVNRLEVVSANPEQVLNGTMDREKPLSLRHGLEAAHLTLLLPGTLVRDLGPVVLVLTRSMFNRWEDLTMGSGIAPESVGGQLPRSLTLALQHLAKETLSSPLISFLRHENIDHVTVLIHCSPKGVELSVDLDEDFVDKPVLAKSGPFSLAETKQRSGRTCGASIESPRRRQSRRAQRADLPLLASSRQIDGTTRARD